MMTGISIEEVNADIYYATARKIYEELEDDMDLFLDALNEGTLERFRAMAIDEAESDMADAGHNG